ncbi:uncharacterized protein FTJAE_11464 [Fusarium tjaetaba]|uniref:Uncharacterized protein n=1 Tax=Fusarium tjaetaba TaxID=1567544 RepID=A0A8H5VG73_9HYPO|nr:uncharacterized protein FTJAE_11464 [Fusarium tjaetaba]KAF5621123.1 hypothetical protein FTJAE_11464 [Fusarium tjaetaba]
MKEYNEKIRECTTGYEGMIMTTQWAQGETNVEIALATSQDSRHMRSIALVTMIFLPGTFFASIFSMGFFEWKSNDGTISVSQSFWIYVVLAAGFTAFTVGAWWYIGVYRYKRHKNMSSALKASLSLVLYITKTLCLKSLLSRSQELSVLHPSLSSYELAKYRINAVTLMYGEADMSDAIMESQRQVVLL